MAQPYLINDLKEEVVRLADAIDELIDSDADEAIVYKIKQYLSLVRAELDKLEA
jgi:hypothetical protein